MTISQALALVSRAGMAFDVWTTAAAETGAQVRIELSDGAAPRVRTQMSWDWRPGGWSK